MKIKKIGKKLYLMLLHPRNVLLRRPELPDEKITVTRTWIGRLFKSSIYATPMEVMKSYHDGDLSI